MNKDYLYHSFLPYFESLHLGRWMSALCNMTYRLHRNGRIPENLAEAASCNLRTLAPQIRPATSSPEEFTDTLIREAKLSKMSDAEKEEFFSAEWKEIAAKIDIGEIDIWDDTPTYANPVEVKRFIHESIAYFHSKLEKAANPSTSFLEAVAIHVFRTLDKVQAGAEKESIRETRGLQALLLTWDSARMVHEGRPPYQIEFSPQVAEALGIDPVVEASKLATNFALTPSLSRSALAAARTATRNLPEYQDEIKALVAKIKHKES